MFSVFPNPFNAVATISYSLPYPGNVSLQIYNLTGQQITTLFEGNKQPGIHNTTLNANSMPSGLYFVKLKASNQVFTQKVMLIK
ncbi:MAG: T9SS type A sorting domain-containing protein [Calditrichaeota bacterium]|nr:T9SS type A sorting domain-containing protein [Calditrichota bacterium]